MKKLIEYLNSIPREEQALLCRRCGTTIGYIRKASSKGQLLGEKLCINFERETNGSVKVESIRPDVDWAFIRETKAA